MQFKLIYEFGDDNNPDWVHVSYVPNGRRELLKAFKINKQTKYFTYA
jgi:hypothetical protein